MAIKERKRLDKVTKKIIATEEGDVTVYEARYSVEDYDDTITPVKGKPAVIGQREKTVPAVPAQPAEYEKDEDGNLVMVKKAVPAIPARPARTPRVKARYNEEGEEISPEVPSVPVIEDYEVEPAVAEVTDVTEFKNYHRKVFTEGVDVIPQEVLDMANG